MQKFRKYIGYREVDPRADVVLDHIYNDAMPWPEVSWLRVGVLTATVKSSAPRTVYAAYQDWAGWADFIQEVRPIPPAPPASLQPHACVRRCNT